MRAATTTAWTKPSNIEVILSDPESALAGCTPAQTGKEGFQLISASAESRDIGKLHLAGGDSGFGEFWADAKTARLISAGLLCNDAANLIPSLSLRDRSRAHDASTRGCGVLSPDQDRDHSPRSATRVVRN